MVDTEKTKKNLPEILQDASDRFSLTYREIADLQEDHGPVAQARSLGRAEVYDWFKTQLETFMGVRLPEPSEYETLDEENRRLSADQVIEQGLF